MIGIMERFLKLCGHKSIKIKQSVIFGFFDGIFESFPFIAVLYFFQKLEANSWSPTNLTWQDIGTMTGILVVGLIGRWAMKYYVYHLQGVASYEAIADARLFVGDHLKHAPMGFFNDGSIGDTITTLTDDMHFIEQNAANVLEKGVNGCINVLVLSISVLFFNWSLGVIFLIGQLLSMVIISTMQKAGQKMAPKVKEAQSKTNSKVIEYLMGLATYKLFPDTKGEVGSIKDTFEEYRKVSFDMEKSFIGKNLGFLLIERVTCAIIMFLTAFLVLDGKINMVKGIVLLIAVFVIYRPLEVLGSMSGMLRMMEVSLNRIDQMAEMPVMEGGSSKPKNNSISMERITFSYDRSEDIIQDVTLDIPENSMTAIIGPSGCGKTTLTRLMARFWDIDQGAVRIGGVDVRNIPIDELYNHFSIVFQKVFLFNDTIEDNIKFGKPDATHEEVVGAARKACCHEFIESLPQGYHTLAGENGGSLSGGEKQRISIARAILKNAPIILLDEATSSVDPENEWMLNQAIYELVKDKTVVIIAHKMNTIRRANQIVVMEKGRIHNIGTNEELMRIDSIYQTYWKSRQTASNWKI